MRTESWHAPHGLVHRMQFQQECAPEAAFALLLLMHTCNDCMSCVLAYQPHMYEREEAPNSVFGFFPSSLMCSEASNAYVPSVPR